MSKQAKSDQSVAFDADRRRILMAMAAGAAAVVSGISCLRKVPNGRSTTMITGADNFYRSDRVTLEKVTFKTAYKTNLVANLFTPKDLNRTAKSPAIIVSRPMGAVKEQSANLYATKMAEQGFVAMAIDLPF